jgi:hypothetical protein
MWIVRSCRIDGLTPQLVALQTSREAVTSERRSPRGSDSVQTSEQRPLDQLTREKFDDRLAMTLTGVQDDLEYRKSAGSQCWDLMVEISESRATADQTGKVWNPLRLAGAAIPALVAGAGGVLVGHLHGNAGTVIGWVALIGGVAGASINAMRPADHYAADQLRAARFRGLYWVHPGQR